MHNKIKRIIKIKMDNKGFRDINTEGFEFIIPQKNNHQIISHKFNNKIKQTKKEKLVNFVYAISYKEIFYDNSINNILDHYDFLDNLPLLYHINQNFKPGELITSCQNFNSLNNFYYTNDPIYLKNNLILNNNIFNLFKNYIFLYTKSKSYGLNFNSIYTDRYIDINSSQKEITGKMNIIHPLFILFRNLYSLITQEDYLDICKPYDLLQFSYQSVLKKIERKEKIAFQNRDFFKCREIDLTSLKYLSSIVAIQDFIYVIDSFFDIGYIKGFPFNDKWIPLFWKNAVLDNAITDESLFRNELYNSDIINIINSKQMEGIINKIAESNNMDLLSLILNNEEYKKYHKQATILIEKNNINKDCHIIKNISTKKRL